MEDKNIAFQPKKRWILLNCGTFIAAISIFMYVLLLFWLFILFFSINTLRIHLTFLPNNSASSFQMLVINLLREIKMRVKVYFKFHNVLIMLMMMMMMMTACSCFCLFVVFFLLCSRPLKNPLESKTFFLIYRCFFLHEWMNHFPTIGECFQRI